MFCRSPHLGAILLAATYLSADAQNASFSEAARTFKFEGSGFESSPDSIRTKWRSAYRLADQSDDRIALLVLRIDATSSTDGIDFWFLDKRLFKMVAWYAPPRVNNMGGPEVFVKRLVARIGKCDDINQKKGDDWSNTFTWQFPDVNRLIVLSVTSDMMSISVTDTAQLEAYKTKRGATADFGF